MKIKRKAAFFLALIFALPLLAANAPGIRADKGANRLGEDPKSLKILAVGNSFSENAFTFLYQIARDAGYEDIRLGNLYIAGCSLQTHWNNAKNNSPSYTYNTNNDGVWKASPGTTLLSALVSEEWDYVVLQQVSTHSGIAASFEPYLQNLIDYVNANKTSEKTKLAWHMTWAYAVESTHAGFVNYDKDQDTMYRAIIHAAQSGVAEKYPDQIELLLPSGTVVQNMRTSYIPDADFTSDGYHLSQRLGCFAAGLTWFAAFTGEDISLAKTDLITEFKLDVVKEAVTAALHTPYDVTPSSFATDPAEDFDPEGYELFDWRPIAFSYWNATGMAGCYTDYNAELNKKFIASGKKLTKDDIPPGSVIYVEPGYQYRAEKWPETGLVTAAREPNTNEKIVFVTESWWSDYTYVTFNLSKIDGTFISEDKNTHSPALKIYVPQKVKKPYDGRTAEVIPETVTATAVILQTEEGFEYSLDGVLWQKEGVFENLLPGTEYTFYCRAAETDDTLAGPAGDAFAVTTKGEGSGEGSGGGVSGGESSPKPEKKDPLPKAVLYGGISALALLAVLFGGGYAVKRRKK